METSRAATLTVSEPFDSTLSSVSGVVVAEASDGRMLFRLTVSIQTIAGDVAYFVLSPRSSAFSENESVEVSAIGLTDDPTTEPGWGADHWRGAGLAAIATLRWHVG